MSGGAVSGGDADVTSPSATTSESAEGRSRFSYCSLPPAPVRQLPSGISGPRARAIIVNDAKWLNGTTLRYYFFDRDTDGEEVVLADGSTRFIPWTTDDAHKDIVRRAFAAWKELGIGLEFVEVNRRQDAEIRIGFMQGDGSWSYVGRDVLKQPTSARTMNLGWPLAGSGGQAADMDTPIHEIGHTLGLPHEHQNPNAGMVWDEEKVYAELAKPPNSWPREQTHWNIIRKIPPDQVQGSNWDPDSVMHYPFEAGLILEPKEYRTKPLQPPGGLSGRDRTWIRSFYPPLDEQRFPELKPFESQALSIGPGQQRDFVVLPPATRKYTFGTFGAADTVAALFEDVEGSLRFTVGDDDSGEDRNAQFEVKLFSGRRYVFRVRLYYASKSGETAAMMW